MEGRPLDYIFDRELEAERQRLELQAAVWDPRTLRLLADTGLREGWRCLEVGAGAGSVARWLGGRVGEAGRVVATDVDTRFLEPLRGPRLEVRRHDILNDALEEGAYDLVHARLVLIHLPRATDVVHKPARAVRPGGWVVLEDFDLRISCLSDPADDTYVKAAKILTTLLEAARGGPARGLELPGALDAAGLVDVRADAAAIVLESGSEDMQVVTASMEQLRRPAVSAGLLTNEELDAAIARLQDRSAPLMGSARGRRPEPA